MKKVGYLEPNHSCPPHIIYDIFDKDIPNPQDVLMCKCGLYFVVTAVTPGHWVEGGKVRIASLRDATSADMLDLMYS